MNTEEAVRKTVDLLFPSGQVVEVRALGDRTWYGYYTESDRLIQDAAILDSTPGISGVYITLNEVNPALLSRCANRVRMAGKRESQTADGDIIRRFWLPVDIDPIRPSGISSSDAEHEAALKKAQTIRQFLSELGWPEPLCADSGNGAHLLYRIDLPASQETGGLIRDCLKTLDTFFGDSTSTIDTSVHNPARIWKLYGTRSRKGDHTPERPHRRSAIISVPEQFTPVPEHSLMQLAALGEPVQREERIPQENGRISDLGVWLDRYGLTHTEKPYQGGRLFVLDRCPFSTAHTDGAYAIQFANGAIFAGCHHDSCGGNTQRWKELKDRYEPEPSPGKPDGGGGFREKNRLRAAKPRMIPGGFEPASPGNPERQGQVTEMESDPDITAEAVRILREGDPVRYILDTFARSHVGDRIVARCLVMSLASKAVVNSKGLHVLVTGESGKGKSHAFETMLDLIPQEFRLSGPMSDKALFYAKDLKRGSVICLDDISLSDQMQEILKGVTTSFQKPLSYRTVDKDRNGLVRIIPERCLWWVAKVEGTGDDQIWNRMLTVWIDDSQEQDDNVLKSELRAAARLTGEPREVSREMRVCREIWRSIRPVPVVIPYAEQIRFSSSKNRRNPSMLLDLIRSVTVMHQYRREKHEMNGSTGIIATREDFEQARDIYLLLNGVSGGQMTKLTRTESMLVDAIRKSGRDIFTIGELQELVTRSYTTVHRMIHGHMARGTHYSGLLEKCPPLSLYDRTETVAEGVQKRNRVYIWDYEMDHLWSSGGGCWLDESDDRDPGDPDPGPGGSGDDGRLCTTIHHSGEVCCTQNTEEEETKLENNSTCTYSSEDVQQNTPTHSKPDDPMPHTFAGTVVAQSLQDDQTVDNKPPDTDSTPGNHGGSISPIPCTPPDDQHTRQPETKSRLRRRDIDPDRYTRISLLNTRTCSCCGRKGVRYREQRGREELFLCERCHNRAVSRKILTFRALPGVLPLHAMNRTTRDLGRCSLCSIQPVSWWDDATKTGLCESCYHRERYHNRAISAGGE